MFPRRSLSRSGAIPVQLGAILAAVLVLVALPPRSGRILLVPLSAAAARTMLPAAIARGALLVGAGPLAGSIVVVGDRAGLAAALLRDGTLLLSAPPAGCGR